MTFKELFSQFSFAEIRPAFLNLWQTNEPKLVEHLDLDKWERITSKRWRQNHPNIISA